MTCAAVRHPEYLLTLFREVDVRNEDGHEFFDVLVGCTVFVGVWHNVIRIGLELVCTLLEPVEQPSGMNQLVKQDLIAQHAGLKRSQVGRDSRL